MIQPQHNSTTAAAEADMGSGIHQTTQGVSKGIVSRTQFGSYPLSCLTSIYKSYNSSRSMC